MPTIGVVSVKAQPFGAVFTVKRVCADGHHAFQMSGHCPRVERFVNGHIGTIIKLPWVEFRARNKGGRIRYKQCSVNVSTSPLKRTWDVSFLPLEPDDPANRVYLTSRSVVEL